MALGVTWVKTRIIGRRKCAVRCGRTSVRETTNYDNNSSKLDNRQWYRHDLKLKSSFQHVSTKSLIFSPTKLRRNLALQFISRLFMVA